MIKRKDFKPIIERHGAHSISYGSGDTIDTLTKQLNLYISENKIKIINIETYLYIYDDYKFDALRLWYIDLKPAITL
jgi:hypothetical protein